MDIDWDALPDKYWHYFVLPQGRQKAPAYAVVNDAAKAQVRKELVEPWHLNRSFAVAGTVIAARSQIAEIRIVQTDRPLKDFIADHDRRMHDAGINDMATRRSLLPFGKGSDFTNRVLFEVAGTAPSAPDVEMLVRLCGRLPQAARVLARRARGKPAFEIKDEYDAQDLLHAIVRAYFKYTVVEEPLGKVAGVSSRADLAVEELGALIELKFARGPQDQNRIVEEFAQDLLLYSRWTPLSTFIYVVVNADDLRDPEALDALSGTHEINGKRFRTFVIRA
jgi:hypothetical protein